VASYEVLKTWVFEHGNERRMCDAYVIQTGRIEIRSDCPTAR
jgi:hypothetical protein